MSLHSKVLDDHFWKILSTLDSLNQDVSLNEICHHLGGSVKEEEILEVLTFLRKFEFPIKVHKKEGVNWLTFTGKKPKISMELSLSEWISLQAHFPLLDGYKGREIYNTLATRFKRLEARYPQSDLFRVLEEEQELGKIQGLISKDKETILTEITQASIECQLVVVKTSEESSVEVFPHKVVYLDGILSLIGEDVNDRCLICVDFDSIISCHSITDHSYKPNFVNAEIEDFIMAIRSVTGNEERLVLRVSAPEKVNLKPQFHFLGSPYVTTNTEGEFIWAASVEVSDELFRWLESIKDDVEILDPQELREEFESFLTKNQTKSTFKKAS
ncbi:MAG: WYL domain-containing protein [Halobacteriovoraceae bacterium]|jgi:hypothetical protein|nr:WYL domain-containing protein [Halobacteriovoraceae bacterium]